MAENIYEIEGDYQLHTGDNTGAIKSYTQAIQQEPNNAKLYIKRIEAEEVLGMNNEVLEDLEKVLKLSPNSAEGYYVKSIIAYSHYSQDIPAALDYADKALELEPNYAEVYNWRAFLKRQKKDYIAALTDHDKAIEFVNNHYYFYFLRGETRADLKDFAGAVQDYSKAIEINPKYANAYRQRGKVLKKMGDKSATKADFKTARELGNFTNSELILAHILSFILTFLVCIFIFPYISKMDIDGRTEGGIYCTIYLFFFIPLSKCIKKFYSRK